VLATRALIVIGSLLLPWAANASPRPDLAPDQVRLNDGTELRGLILLNTRDTVVIQTENGESRVPKEYIRRIDDAPNGEAIFADILDKDELPSWRSIVHDLRTHDSVRLFEQIPPTRIDNGLLRNIPYLSFRVNDKWEMNVYGNPDRPVAVEFGIYGSAGSDKSSIRTFREFIAGHLHAKEQIAALYRLGPQNRQMRAGQLAFRFIRPDDPDGYGGSWIVVYRPDKIEGARLSDKKYAAITRPFEEVNNPDGSLRADKMDENIGWLDRMMEMITGEDPELRGFYRDKNGVFRVLTSES
jgi:hypothetical protein